MGERIGEGELVVMEALWREGRPLTATEIREMVGPSRGWSESTVKTMLSRLVNKGVIRHREEGRRFLYTPARERGDYAADEARRLVDRLFGGRATPLVAHLAEGGGLSHADLAALKTLVDRLYEQARTASPEG